MPNTSASGSSERAGKFEAVSEDHGATIVASSFGELIAAMAGNSVYHSVSERQFADVFRAVLPGLSIPHALPRVVVVVGAGATHAASGLPCGVDAAEYLRKEIEKVIGDRLVKEKIDSLALQFNLEEGDFETILLALSQIDRNKVLQELGSIFSRKHHPWLGYELLAHCLKHRFIDAVVNFNFDEILDQTIEDELGTGAFYKVVLEGDCPNSVDAWLDRTERKFKLPLYIKPHGSASQPSSMRFTRESYTALPEGFAKLLGELFSPKQPVYVLVLGHAMQSIEFNHQIRRAAGGRSPDTALKFFFFEAKERLKGFADKIDDTLCTCVVPPKNMSNDVALRQIWDSIQALFSDAAKPRGIERHILVSRLFESRRIENWLEFVRTDTGDSRAKRLVAYFRDRTLLEVALAIAKAKGFASLDDLARGRVGSYFGLYREYSSHDTDANRLRSICDACYRLGLRPNGYDERIITLAELGGVVDLDCNKMTLTEDEFAVAAPQLAENALHEMLSIGRARMRFLEQFVNALKVMYHGEEVEVSTSGSANRTLLFERAKILPTLSALKFRTEEIMTAPHPDWDRFVCTAESGQWLLRNTVVRDAILKRKAKFALVVADATSRSELLKVYDGLVTSISHMPWWLHNRHVTVFLNRGGTKSAISFDRRMRTATITPLYLSSDKDVRSAWASFVAYWRKAKRYALGSNDAFISPDDLGDAENELLAELY